MKDKIRNSLLIISIVYSVIIIILMICSYVTSSNTIEFNDDSKNIAVLDGYKEELNNIKESACKDSINNLINHYEKSSYKGQVNLKDKYLLEEGLIAYASETFENCKLDEKTKKEISTKILAASIQFDEVLQKLYFQYEIRISDLYNRSIIEPDLNSVRYKINRNLQLEIIEELIDNLKEES